MPKQLSYKEQDSKKCIEKSQEILNELPDFVTGFAYDLGSNVLPRTKLAYLYDVRRFLRWWADKNKCEIKSVTIDMMNALSIMDINEYRTYLSIDDENPNGQNGEARKMTSLNQLLDFLYRTDEIPSNPFGKMRARRRGIKSPPIVRLQPNETVAYLDCAENGGVGSEHQKKILSHTKIRDTAILTLLLGTGMRVSECVGLNIEDINFDELTILITRKGNKQQYIAMGDEVIDALKTYWPVRLDIVPCHGDESALFLSGQKKRLCVRSVENLVKKYAKMTGIQKNITPHKLRKTFGTELYNETHDIYIVATALGHNNTNTTKDHYVMQSEENLLAVRNKVKLKKD